MNFYYKSIPSETMSDFAHYYEHIAENLPNNAFVAELGVADGRSIIMLASMLSYRKKRANLWAVDNFSYGKDLQRSTFETNIHNCGEWSSENTFLYQPNVAEKTTTTLQVMDMETLVAATRCQDEQFDFVFIDSSHLYEMTKAEIRLWLHKVKKGGILAGHDYCDNEEVRKAVDELIPAGELIICETTSGHGVWQVIKKDGFKLLK